MPETHADPVPPPGVDLERPSVARVYDYYLGGTANWAVDREFGDRVLARFPLLRDIAVANRLFLNRVVRYLAKRGVRQFLDVGAGVPTVGNTHQVADEARQETGGVPDVRVVYVTTSRSPSRTRTCYSATRAIPRGTRSSKLIFVTRTPCGRRRSRPT